MDYAAENAMLYRKLALAYIEQLMGLLREHDIKVPLLGPGIAPHENILIHSMFKNDLLTLHSKTRTQVDQPTP